MMHMYIYIDTHIYIYTIYYIIHIIQRALTPVTGSNLVISLLRRCLGPLPEDAAAYCEDVGEACQEVGRKNLPSGKLI